MLTYIHVHVLEIPFKHIPLYVAILYRSDNAILIIVLYINSTKTVLVHTCIYIVVHFMSFIPYM